MEATTSYDLLWIVDALLILYIKGHNKDVTQGSSKITSESFKKSQNCVEAAIAFVFTSCKRQLLFAILQLITFVCITAFDNFYNQQIITIFAFKCTMGIVNFLYTIAIDNFCMHYYK